MKSSHAFWGNYLTAEAVFRTHDITIFILSESTEYLTIGTFPSSQYIHQRYVHIR